MSMGASHQQSKVCCIWETSYSDAAELCLSYAPGGEGFRLVKNSGGGLIRISLS